MAPFNTHFLIAEKIWPDVKRMTAWPVSYNDILYGQFCFGCVAPDVDKLSGTLTQRDTHFFDRSGEYDLMASHRTAAFLTQQTRFLDRPFADLPAEAQAFGLGYLCHLSVDEVSKHRWRRETWLQFDQVAPAIAFSALDELARQHIQDYAAISRALCAITAVDVLALIPRADLDRMVQGVCRFGRATHTEAEFLTLVDLFEAPPPAQRRLRQQQFQSQIETARRHVHLFELEAMIKASLAHSRRRLIDLVEGRTPDPSFPVLDF